MTRPYPLTFAPILKPKVWGGRRLEQFGKTLPAGARIGESWELADLPTSVPNGQSLVAAGLWAGRSLRELIKADRSGILGSSRPFDDGAFPLLIKFLDACQDLSVQVHPDADYAARHTGADLKSEAWVVMMADPGAVIYCGLKPGVTPDSLRSAIADGTVPGLLHAVPAEPGQCYYLPSGTCHALGAGVLVAEVQTPSDTTFRVFDWGRRDRELHIERAIKCIDFAAPVVRPSTADQDGLLCSTPFFEIHRVVEQGPLPVGGGPAVLMVLGGAGTLQAAQTGQIDLIPGSTVLLPAALEDVWCRFDRPSNVLRITLPSR